MMLFCVDILELGGSWLSNSPESITVVVLAEAANEVEF